MHGVHAMHSVSKLGTAPSPTWTAAESLGVCFPITVVETINPESRPGKHKAAGHRGLVAPWP